MTSIRMAGPTSRKSKSNASDATAHAWERAVRLLTARDRSEQEIRDRLAADKIPAAVIAATVRRLRQLRYVDDRRFAHSAAEHARRRGHGSERVRAELAAKGIGESLIDEAVLTVFTDETALARLALARRYPTDALEPAARAKAARFLLRLGFPEAVVSTVLGDEVC